ncbi:MAG: hypothetical protein V4736_06755 [Bdellovibrionota bacterium]
MKNLTGLTIILSACLLTACGSENPDRQAPPETGKYITVEGEQVQTMADPKVNILFVVDNSGSMKPHQATMQKNVELFAKHFLSNPRIDYKIGVVPVYDRKYLNDPVVYPTAGLRKMNPLGELVQLKGKSPDDKSSNLFITRKTLNARKVLVETVAIGTQWGPEAEESFSPVIAVMDPTINKEKNGDFYDQDAYLAVIFLTDADDVTPGLSGSDFYDQLVALKGGNRSKVLIAAAIPSLNNNSAECAKDGKGPLQAFPDLLARSGGIQADLCAGDFGKRLASFGRYLVQRVGTQKVALGFTPDIKSIQVTYGRPGSSESERLTVPRGMNGYLFNPDSNEIMLSPDMDMPRQEGGVVFVKAIPANLANYKNGRLKEIDYSK